SSRGEAALEGVVSGRIDERGIGEAQLSGTTRLQVREVRTIWPLLREAGVTPPPEIDSIDGTFDAALTAQGRVADPTLFTTIAGRSLHAPGFADAGELDATLLVTRTGITAKAFRANLSHTRMTASGDYEWSGPIAARFDVSADDLAPLAAVFGGTPLV